MPTPVATDQKAAGKAPKAKRNKLALPISAEMLAEAMKCVRIKTTVDRATIARKLNLSYGDSFILAAFAKAEAERRVS
jgi:hypothetical protein